MNNNHNRKRSMEPNTSAEGDNTINTKKGFLISLPSKKKNVEPGSGIVHAKTMNEPNGPRPKAPEKNEQTGSAGRTDKDKNEKQGRSDRPKGQNGASRPNAQKPARPDGTGDRDAARDFTKRPPKKPRREAPAEKGAQNAANSGAAANAPTQSAARPQGEAAVQTGNAERGGKHGGNRPNQNRNRPQNASGNTNHEKNPNPPRDRGDKEKAQGAENGGSKAPSRERPPKGAKQDMKKGASSQDRPQNRPKKPRDNSRDRSNKRREPKMPSLSPLSGDMMSFGKQKADDALGNDKRNFKKEPSFEEKYKNAVPLAEQIALEEQKRQVKPRAQITENIDRALTANVLGHEVAEEARETVPADNDEAVRETPATGNAHADGEKPPYEVVGIRFREGGKIYYFDPDGKDIPFGTPVIVETSRGCEYGYTAISNRLVPYDSVVPPLKKLKRVATAADTEKFNANKRLESEAAEIFKKKVKELNLAMNLIYVEYTFDNSKLLFYFTAETRIDFRELVKELASIFRTRIELRQIGVRDEAKMLGGLGVCGRGVCCNSFLGDFAQVSIKMAKEQGLSLNSAKISGACGKLMCCLRYEDAVYREEVARTPKIGAVVETAEGRGVVTEANALGGTVKVTLDAAPEAPAKVFSREDVKVVGFNKAAVRAKEAEDENEGDLAALEDEKN